ncbi:hypothetical protein EK904_002236, partial [Melospiza melodia maxima]
MLRWAVHLEGGPRRVNHAAVAVGHKLPPVWTNSRDHVREVPYMRYGHSAVLIDDTVYIWGGRNDTEGACNVLYAFDVNTHKWFTPKVSGMVPGARDGHSACVLAKSMFIFGGYEQLADCFSNDIHKLDTTNMTWTLISAKGTPARWRDFHSATIIGTKMYVFGGRADRFGPFHSNNEIYCNRIKVFDTETNSWLDSPHTPVLPEGRRSHSAFSYNGELYVFGGYNARLNRHFHDLWKFNPVSLSWRKIEPKGKGPCPRRRQCCCRVGDRIILFGGTSPSPEEGMGDEFDLMDHSDLYILDFSPSLKTLCKLAVIQYSLDQSCLPHDIRRLQKEARSSRVSRFSHSRRRRRQRFPASPRHPSPGSMTIFCSHCHRPLQAEMSCLPARAKQAPSAPRPFRSTKSASKARRDQINAELQALRSLLPISAQEKERLSYLHTMALVCLRLRGAQLFPPGLAPPTGPALGTELLSLLPGFLLVLSADSKLVYISENVAQVLGLSVVELLAQGDTVFDILDGRVGEDVHKKLLLAREEPGREVTFVCEMRTSKAFRLQHGGNRVVAVCGRFDDMFQSMHLLDMTFIDVTE